MFICPSSNVVQDDFGTGGAMNRSGFASGDSWSMSRVSYGITNPYPTVSGVTRGYKWTNDQRQDFAVWADKNPAGSSTYNTPLLSSGLTTGAPATLLVKANSRNHAGVGQNVLYGDGHVEWMLTPRCGVAGDNIYTGGGNNSPTQDSSGNPTDWDVRNPDGTGGNVPSANSSPTGCAPYDASDTIMVPASQWYEN